MENYHNNPNQATNFGDLIMPTQLYWINVAAESVGMDKEETALALFKCNLYELSRTAGEQMLQYFARVKANGGAGADHEHDCASCGDTFTCSDALCSTMLARYCDGCTEEALSAMWEEASHAPVSHGRAQVNLDDDGPLTVATVNNPMAGRVIGPHPNATGLQVSHPLAGILVKPQPSSNGRLGGIEI